MSAEKAIEMAAKVFLFAAQVKLLEAQAETLERAEDRLTAAAEQQLAWSQFLYDRYTQKIVFCEDKMLLASCEKAPYVPQYDAAQNRLKAAVLSSFALREKETRRNAGLWCGGASKGDFRKIQIAKGVAMANAVTAAYRVEDARVEADEERIYSRLVNAANLGRGFAASAAASAATSAALWGQIGQAAGNAMAGNLRGVGEGIAGFADLLKKENSIGKVETPIERQTAYEQNSDLRENRRMTPNYISNSYPNFGTITTDPTGTIFPEVTGYGKEEG